MRLPGAMSTIHALRSRALALTLGGGSWLLQQNISKEVAVTPLEAPRVAAPYSGAVPVLWERLQLAPRGGPEPLRLLVASPWQDHAQEAPPRAAVLLLHATGKSKSYLAEHLERLAQRGYVAVAFDASWHGERSLPDSGIGSGGESLASLGPELPARMASMEAARLRVYFEALVRAWRTGDGRPFLYDTVRDSFSVMDYLCSRADVDPARIGVTGVSLGGMTAWLLAAADKRVAAVAPAIGVQSFRYALENDLWHARVNSIWPVFEAARQDFGAENISAHIVEAVWRRIVPGLADADGASLVSFDAPSSLGCISPRPLLVLSGEADPRCPIEGVHQAVAEARQVYHADGVAGNINLFVQPGIKHEMTPIMWEEIDKFFDSVLSRGDSSSRSGESRTSDESLRHLSAL